MKLPFLVFNVSHVSKRLIEMKAEELGSRIKWVSAASALGGAVPVPGISAAVDLALVLAEVKFQKEQLQIDDGTMEKHAERFGSVVKEKLEAEWELVKFMGQEENTELREKLELLDEDIQDQQVGQG